MHLVSVAEFLQAVAAAVAIARLSILGIGRRQIALLLFLVANVLSTVILGSLNAASQLYFFAYLLSTGMTLVTSIFAVREMFSLTFEKYPGIRTAGRRIMYAATAFSAVLALAATAYFNRGGVHAPSHLYFVEILDRSIVSALAIIVVAILIALSHYPLHLSRNTYVSTLFFSAILLSEAVQLLIDSLHDVLFARDVDIAQVGFAIICLVGWSFMLRREEAHFDEPQLTFKLPQETELLRQLEELNALLSKAGRR